PPVLPRGGGTSLAGQAVGRAIILDCSKYMNRIQSLDPAARQARVQPGVVQDDLNLAGRPHGLRLGPDTATSNRATLGGMMGNNSCGARSIVYGKMMDHVQELRMLLIDGTELRLRRDGRSAPRPPRGSREGEVFDTVAAIVEHNDDEIARRFPNLLRRVSGYNLDALRRDPRDLISLLVGSEGTLGVITEATVGLVPQPGHAVLAVVHFADLFAALEAVPQILPLRPSAVELIDRMVLEMTAAQLEYARRMTFVQGAPDAVLVVEFSGDERRDIEKMKAIASAVGDLVVEFGGTMSGEHGDGLVRSWFVERFFGPQIYAAFQEVKRAFDPPGLLNPGKIVAAPPIDASLRFGTEYRTRPVPTYFDWSRDGGMAASVELCSGVGACRKTSEGTMCPSYMVTREEEHSTRGRANLLRAVLSGVLPPQDLVGRRLFEALDLCLECKGCK